MIGKCLCGEVAFEILGSIPRLYQCHCSLCRKQSGTASNAATIVGARKFRWLNGEQALSSWCKDSGFRSDFCAACGSPVPNPLRGLPYYWIPVGLLETDAPLRFAAQLHLASRAPWDACDGDGLHYDSMPDLSAFLELLGSDVP